MKRRVFTGFLIRISFLVLGVTVLALAQGTTDGLLIGDRSYGLGTPLEPTHYMIHGRPDGAALYRGYQDGDSVVVTAVFTRRGWASLVESERLKTAEHTVVPLRKLLELISRDRP
jgi:hypothetical protein